MLQSADKFLKAVCQMGNLVVVFLIHMDSPQALPGAASPVVQGKSYRVRRWDSRRWPPDGRILPLIDHKLAAQLPAEGAAFSRPMPKMPVMATWSSAQQVGSSQG